jgi:hypothetical protein
MLAEFGVMVAVYTLGRVAVLYNSPTSRRVAGDYSVEEYSFCMGEVYPHHSSLPFGENYCKAAVKKKKLSPPLGGPEVPV